jgi:hypothetical protein
MEEQASVGVPAGTDYWTVTLFARLRGFVHVAAELDGEVLPIVLSFCTEVCLTSHCLEVSPHGTNRPHSKITRGLGNACHERINMFVVILVVLFLAVVAAGIYLSQGWANMETERVASFGVEPNFICPSDSCRVDISYEVTTTHDNTKAVLQVIGPKGTVSELASSLTFARSTNGADAGLWIDGPGEYQFVLNVTGDQIGNISQVSKTTLFPKEGGVIAYTARVDMSQAVELQVARDSVTLTELHKLKNPEFTICEKCAELVGIRYLEGGISGHDRVLDITVRNVDGILADFPKMQPGDGVKIHPPISLARGGLEFDGMMVGGFTGNPPFSIPNPFAATDIVGWSLEFDIHCIGG